MNKEQPNWVTEYNHYTNLEQKKEEFLRLIRKLYLGKSRKLRGQDKPNQILF